MAPGSTIRSGFPAPRRSVGEAYPASLACLRRSYYEEVRIVKENYAPRRSPRFRVKSPAERPIINRAVRDGIDTQREKYRRHHACAKELARAGGMSRRAQAGSGPHIPNLCLGDLARRSS